MKKYITLILVLTIGCFHTQLEAQDLTVSDGYTEYDDVKRPAVKVILEPSTKAVKKAWRDWMEDRYDVDVDGFGFLKNKDVLKIEGQRVSAISDKKMDVYARFDKKGDYTEMYIFGDYGYDILVEPGYEENNDYNRMRTMTYNFLNEYLPGFYEEKVEEKEDMVNDLQDDYEDAKNELAENKKEIKELNQKNEELVKRIATYEEDILAEKEVLKERREEFKEIQKKTTNNDQ